MHLLVSDLNIYQNPWRNNEEKHQDCTYVDRSLHFLAVCLVLRPRDGLVKLSETCSLCMWLRIWFVCDWNVIIFSRLKIAVGQYNRPVSLSSAEWTVRVFITKVFPNVSRPSILLSVLRQVHSLFQCDGELLFSLRSSSSCLCLLPLLFVPYIFPSKTCFRTQFSRKITSYMWRKNATVLHVMIDVTAF